MTTQTSTAAKTEAKLFSALKTDEDQTKFTATMDLLIGNHFHTNKDAVFENLAFLGSTKAFEKEVDEKVVDTLGENAFEMVLKNINPETLYVFTDENTPEALSKATRKAKTEKVKSFVDLSKKLVKKITTSDFSVPATKKEYRANDVNKHTPLFF